MTMTEPRQEEGRRADEAPAELDIHVIRAPAEMPSWLSVERLAWFLHHGMRPYEDELEDVHGGLEHALGEDPPGGFVVVATTGAAVAGAAVFIETGMSGYVPETLMLFACVKPELRGRGVGQRLIETGLARCSGGVTLHVEPGNPARRLYERLGFSSMYVDMRWNPS